MWSKYVTMKNWEWELAMRQTTLTYLSQNQYPECIVFRLQGSGRERERERGKEEESEGGREGGREREGRREGRRERGREEGENEGGREIGRKRGDGTSR